MGNLDNQDLKELDGISNMKPITERINNVPIDVWKVWIINYINQPIGSELYQECIEIINKYPEYFKK